MAFDEGLAVRIEEALSDVPHVEQKRMFGGIAFMVRNHMCVGVVATLPNKKPAAKKMNK